MVQEIVDYDNTPLKWLRLEIIDTNIHMQAQDLEKFRTLQIVKVVLDCILEWDHETLVLSIYIGKKMLGVIIIII